MAGVCVCEGGGGVMYEEPRVKHMGFHVRG